MRVPTGRLRIVSTQPAEVGEVYEGPPSPGRYIRDARQRRGMSIEQLALDTKIPRASLEALEEDRFAALPGPVFVRGFFRCCARALSLDVEHVAGLLHEHQRAQKAAAQRGTRRPTPIHAAPPVHAVAPIREAARAAARPEVGRPRAAEPELTARPAAAVAVAPAPQHLALDALARASARSLELLRALGQLPQSRTLMWIAVCLVIAVIAVTAFALSGGHVSLPHS